MSEGSSRWGNHPAREIGFMLFLRDGEDGIAATAGCGWPAPPLRKRAALESVQPMTVVSGPDKWAYYRQQKSRIRRLLADLDLKTDRQRAQNGLRALCDGWYPPSNKKQTGFRLPRYTECRP